jgi:hypothetical protein
MLENKTNEAAACDAAVPHDNEGTVVGGQYDGPDRRALEQKHWYQTIGNNISQWLAIGGVALSAIIFYGDLRQKEADNNAKHRAIEAALIAVNQRVTDEATRREKEQRDLLSQIDLMIKPLRDDMAYLRNRLDRGR